MKILRVRIIKARHACFWYAPNIGEEFFVEDVDDKPHEESFWRYKIIPNGVFFQRPINKYIRNDDVEILEEFEGHIEESMILSITIERD